MTPGARPLDAIAAAVTVVLCISWGLNQVAIKLAIADIPPLIQATVRSAGALAIIFAWCRWRGVPLFARDGTLTPGLLNGLAFGIEFVLIYRGLTLTTASRGAVFLYTAPFFVALGARLFLPGERLLLVHWLGLALSFAGVALAIGIGGPDAGPDQLIGDLMLVAGGALWATNTLIIKASRLSAAPPEKALAYQLVVSAPILAVAALLFGERLVQVPGPAALSWLAYQTVWVVGLTYAVWCTLLQRYSASRLSSFTFLTPLFGVAAGYLILDEPLTPIFAAAVALVVAGLVLVNRAR